MRAGSVCPMRTDDLDYPFDPGLIATRPAEPRDAARLLVVDRTTGRTEHRTVRDLADYLEPGDALVLNATRVVPARLMLERESTGGRSEGLLLPEGDDGEHGCYLRCAKRVRAGERLLVRDAHDAVRGVFEVLGRADEQVRLRLLEARRCAQRVAERLFERVARRHLSEVRLPACKLRWCGVVQPLQELDGEFRFVKSVAELVKAHALVGKWHVGRTDGRADALVMIGPVGHDEHLIASGRARPSLGSPSGRL